MDFHEYLMMSGAYAGLTGTFKTRTRGTLYPKAETARGEVRHAGWLGGWVAGWVAGWLAGRLAGWLADWLWCHALLNDNRCRFS